MPPQVYPATNDTSSGSYNVVWVHQAPLATVTACSPGLQQNATAGTAAAECWTYSVDGFAGSICMAPVGGVPQGGEEGYRVGCDALGWSTWRKLRSPAADSINMLAYADAGIGWSNGTMGMLAADAASGRFAAVLNHGDISYANDYKPATNNSWVWDQYLNMAEAHLDGAAGPHVAICGNHERQHDFAAYLNRTQMPRSSDKPLGRFYSSTAVGPVTVISFSTEHDTSAGSEIYEFVAGALSAAAEAKHLRPWIVVQTHHPALCTDLLFITTRCGEEAAAIMATFGPLFEAAGVAVFFSGHNHMLEGSWPYFNGTFTTDLHNAKGTVYVVNGAAGDIEGIEPLFIDNPGFRMFDSELSLDTVYARLQVTRTAFAAEFVDSRSGRVTHNFTLTRDD